MVSESVFLLTVSLDSSLTVKGGGGSGGPGGGSSVGEGAYKVMF